MQLNAYLYFNGQCEEAFQFYEKLFGGKIEALFRHRGSPAEQQTPPEWLDKIMHARLNVGNNTLMGSDAPPGHYHDGSKGYSVSIGLNEIKEAERIYQGLAEKGKVNMPLQPTFWAARFAMLVDRFGISWMINCEAQQ
jgi:PhnB protein